MFSPNSCSFLFSIRKWHVVQQQIQVAYALFAILMRRKILFLQALHNAFSSTRTWWGGLGTLKLCRLSKANAMAGSCVSDWRGCIWGSRAVSDALGAPAHILSVSPLSPAVAAAGKSHRLWLTSHPPCLISVMLCESFPFYSGDSLTFQKLLRPKCTS